MTNRPPLARGLKTCYLKLYTHASLYGLGTVSIKFLKRGSSKVVIRRLTKRRPLAAHQASKKGENISGNLFFKGVSTEMTSFSTNRQNSYADITKARILTVRGECVCVCVKERSFLSRLVFILLGSTSFLSSFSPSPSPSLPPSRQKRNKRECSILKGEIAQHRDSSRLPSSDHDRPRFIH